MTIQIRVAESSDDRETCFRLRWTVFVEEQGVRPSIERDAHDDSDAVHVLAELDGVPCGAGRLVPTGPAAFKVQRMAVIDDVRGRGVGRALLAALEAEALRRGATAVALHAQLPARGFYEKAGYRAEGDVFEEAGIQHVRMSKGLRRA